MSIYIILIVGLCREGKYDEVEYLVRNMEEKGLFSNNNIYSFFLVIYCKNLRIEFVLEILKLLTGSELEVSLGIYGLLIIILCKVN